MEFSSEQRARFVKGTTVPPLWAPNAQTLSSVLLKPMTACVAQVRFAAIALYSLMACASANNPACMGAGGVVPEQGHRNSAA